MNTIRLLLRRLTCTVLALFLAAASQAQPLTNPRSAHSLSKRDMYADFDYLATTIKDLNAQMAVRKRLTGLDIPEELSRLRQEIKHCKDDGDFYIVLRKAIDICNDGHANMLWDGFFSLPLSYFQQHSISAIDSIQLAESRRANKAAFASLVDRYARMKLRLPIIYLNGSYITYADFSYKEHTIAKGTPVTKVNGLAVHAFVKSQVKHHLRRWDANHQVLYSHTFYRDLAFTDKNEIVFTFKTMGGEVIPFRYTDTVAFEPLPKAMPEVQPSVHFFKQGNILYVRVPDMNPDYLPFLPDTIKQIGKSHPIDKVIIDIRGNGGGSDNVGLSIIRAVIADSIRTRVKVLANNSPTVRNMIRRTDSTWVEKYENVSYLDNERYLVVEAGDYTLAPDTNSIGYRGNIYILQDEDIFSAAGTLAAVAGYSDKVTNVGSATGYLLGKGATPYLFRLPRSHVMFRIEALIDHSAASSVQDVFHDRVEIMRPLSLDEWLFRKQYKGNVYSQEYLFRYDPVFRLVL